MTALPAILVLCAAGPHTYAVVAGSNTGGAGQAPLRYAEDDARHFSDVLLELGRHDKEGVRLLLHPTSAGISSAIAEIAKAAKANAARGEQSLFVFYYSGHAKANALTPGGEELQLAALREQLAAVPSTLTIVVLDACQSGAFARTKGSEPAADFTYNSVARLNASGLVVMASSTSQELSQESDELSGSYFTHHLVTALRGAADTDADGRVTLDEAYRYAYRRTLAATARTRVGEQHVTLENNLAGHDEVPVTWPAEARAKLELPAPLAGRVLVQRRPSGAVLAEVDKAAGSPVRLALLGGSYDAVISRAGGALQCQLELKDDVTTKLDEAACTPVAVSTVAKGGAELARAEGSRWEAQLGAGLIAGRADSYTQTLHDFGFRRQGGELGPRLDVGASRELLPHVALLLELGFLARVTYARDIGSGRDQASLSAYRAVLGVRLHTRLFGRLGVYAQGTTGVGLGVLGFDTVQSGVAPSSSQLYAGPVVGGAAGLTVAVWRLNVFGQLGYDYAPVIRNLIGQTHDSGGVAVMLGVRLRFGEAP